MTTFIDRRSQGHSKSTIDRDRFIKRHRQKIKDSLNKSLDGKSITDLDKGTDVTLPARDLDEPHIKNSESGIWDLILPGNDKFKTGDTVPRPQKGGKGQGGQGDGDPLQDDFVFTLTKEEFMHLFFEDLALPDLVEKQLTSDDFKFKRAGYQTTGTQNNLSVIQSLKNAIGRKIALRGAIQSEIDLITEELAATFGEASDLRDAVAELEQRKKNIPYIDDHDLKYRSLVKQKKASRKAVMFCLMDVSGSMGEFEKTAAKKFFVLLYLFLTKAYDKVELVFIRHTTEAAEVSEDEFFNSRESGGTKVSSALELMADTIEARYPVAEWNIYGAQASDGDNYYSDSQACHDLMSSRILPAVQFFTYIEITSGMFGQNLWDEYEKLIDTHENIDIAMVRDYKDIYPVFRSFFEKRS